MEWSTKAKDQLSQHYEKLYQALSLNEQNQYNPLNTNRDRFDTKASKHWKLRQYDAPPVNDSTDPLTLGPPFGNNQPGFATNETFLSTLKDDARSPDNGSS